MRPGDCHPLQIWAETDWVCLSEFWHGRVLITGPRGLSSVDPYQTTNKGVAQVNSHNRRTKNIYVCIGALFTWTPRGDWGEKPQRYSEEDTCALLFPLHSSRHQVMALEVCVYNGKSINYWLTVWRSMFSLLCWRPKTWPQRRQTWENEEEIQNPPIHYHFLFLSLHFPLIQCYSTVTVSSAREVSPLTVVNPDLHFWSPESNKPFGSSGKVTATRERESII